MKSRTILTAIAALIITISSYGQSKTFELGRWIDVQNAILKELNASYVDTLPLARMEKAQEIHSRLSMNEAAGRLPQLEKCIRKAGGDDFWRSALACLLQMKWGTAESEAEEAVRPGFLQGYSGERVVFR